ncbi:MAG: STAS domain-containing protein [Saprospiraceae bacterium]
MVLRYALIERRHWLQMILENTQLTEEEALRLKAHLLSLAKLSIPYLILDLSKVKWIDTAGLAALLSAHNAFPKNGLYLVNIEHDPVKTLIKTARLK